MLVGTINKHTTLYALMLIGTVSCVFGSESKKLYVGTRSTADKASRVTILENALEQKKEDKDHPIAQSLDPMQRIVEKEQRSRFNAKTIETKQPKSGSSIDQDAALVQRHEASSKYFADAQEKRAEDKGQRDIQAEAALKKELRKAELSIKKAAEQKTYNEQMDTKLAAKAAFIDEAADFSLEEEVVSVKPLSATFKKPTKTIKRKKETSKQPALADIPAYIAVDQNTTPAKTSSRKADPSFSATRPAITRVAHNQNPERMINRSENMQLNATKKNSGGTYDGSAKNIVESFAKKPNS